jgi:hypothetical protein
MVNLINGLFKNEESEKSLCPVSHSEKNMLLEKCESK